MEEILGRDLIKKNKIDVWYDKVFVRHIVKKIQSVDPNIGAVLYPDQKLIVFFYKRIIIYKILMNEEQTEKFPLNYHIEQIKKIIRLLKLNMIPIRELKTARSNIKNLKLNYGKRLN
jgi:hypothetical protein